MTKKKTISNHPNVEQGNGNHTGPGKQKKIAIGRIGRCVGIRGALKVTPLTSLHERFADLTEVFIGSDEYTAKETGIANVSIQGNGIMVTFSGILDRNAAEQLVGNYVYVNESEKISLPEHEWFIDDIVGCEVFFPSLVSIGIIQDILSLPAQDVWILHDKNAKEILIPAVREIILSVDITRKKIVIQPPEGLIEDETHGKNTK